MECVRALPLLNASACEDAVAEAEAYASAAGGWQTDRHVAYPTTDIPIRKLPKLERMWTEHLFPLVEEEARARLGLGAATSVVPLDVFVVKYASARTQLPTCLLRPRPDPTRASASLPK